MAMHPGLASNFPLRRLDPLVRPILQRLTAQKPHLLDEPLFGRVRLPEVSVQVPHRAHYRRQSVAKTRMGLKKRQKRFVAEFHRHYLSNPSLPNRQLTPHNVESHPVKSPGVIIPMTGVTSVVEFELVKND
jgi:hypothetical protein